jgi:hypothetical protein
VHPEAEPNVEPDWKQKLPPRRNVVTTPAPARPTTPAPSRPNDDVSSILEFFQKNSVAK